MVKIFCKNTGTYKEFQEGTMLLDMINEFDFEKPYEIIAARVNNVAQGLKFRAYQSRDIEFLDYRTYSGRNFPGLQGRDAPPHLERILLQH